MRDALHCERIREKEQLTRTSDIAILDNIQVSNSIDLKSAVQKRDTKTGRQLDPHQTFP